MNFNAAKKNKSLLACFMQLFCRKIPTGFLFMN